MEGAVTTGLMAAEAIRAGAGLGERIPVLRPKVYPGWFLTVLKVVLFPGVLVATSISRVSRLSKNRRAPL
jgi:hypothetical protein